MGSTYTRQSSAGIVDGGVIEASDLNNEFDQLLAAFAVSTGHSHDGTAAEGGPVTKLLGTSITVGDGTAGTDITMTFDGETGDGVLKWMEDEDYFEFSDDILVASTEKLQFRDTAIYINSSTDGQLDLVADTEIQIAATTIDINGAIALNGAITGATDITLSGELDAATLDISGNADIDGTTNLDAVDIDGAVQIDNTITVGVDGTGYDVKFFGDTASAYMLWDESTDDLVLAGAAGIDLAGDIDVDGTANLDNTDIDGTLAVDGTTISLDATTSLNIDNSNTSNGITIGTATSSVPISIGHTTSEVTINDNLTTTGNLSVGGNFDVTGTLDFSDSNITNIGSIALDTITNDGTDITLDSSGDIILDADGADVTLKDDGTTFGSLTQSGGELLIKSGSTPTTAATFSGANVTLAGTVGSGAITSTGVVIGTTVEPNADTSSGDNAAIGYTATEGLILTGQGSTNDITIKNDADSAVISIPTGTTNVTIAGDLTISGDDLTMGTNTDTAIMVADGTNYNPVVPSGDVGLTNAGVFSIASGVIVNADVNASAAIVDTKLDTISTADKVSGAAIQIDGASDGTGITLADADKILVDDGGTTKYVELSQLNTYTSGSIAADDISTGDAAVTLTTSSGNITIDAAADNSDIIFKGTDATSDITMLTLDGSEAGAATFNDKIVATELDISGNMDIDGTSNLDAVDIDGAVQIDGTVTVGVDGTGLDVKFFGDSAGAFGIYDQSEDAFEIRGATAAGPGHLKLTTGELTVVDSDVLGKIEFQAPLESDGSDAVLVGAAIWAEADDTFAAGVNNTDLVFALGKSEAAAEKFRFTADNEIGIAGANYGTDGQVLTSGGEGAACAWEDVTGSITALNNQAESRLVSIGSTTTQLDGEANLTFTGSALTCIGTMTVGVDGTGHDVQFFGATAGAYMLWDENTDDLVLAGAANLYLYDAGGGESLSSDGTDLTINSGSDIHLTATDDVNIPSGVGLTFAATEKIESDGTDLSITVGASGDVNIPADIGLTFGDDGEKIEGDGSDLTISGNTVNLDSSMNHTFSSTGKAMVLGF